mgnify:CR=1 FL=1
MKKSRSLPTYHGFHGKKTYYSAHGLNQDSKDPCFMEDLRPRMTDDQMWSEVFGNIGKVLNWHITAAECTKYSYGTVDKIYDGYEEIDYGTGYGKFNSCHHYKRHAVILPYGLSYRKPKKGAMSITRFWKSSFGVYTIPTVDGHFGDPASASSRAWWTMQPRFEGRISMINFLYELKDVKQLVREALKLVRALKNLRRTWERLKKAFSRSNIDPSKPAAEIYLMKEFGIDPLLKDLSDIMSQISEKVMEAQNAFKDKGEHENVRHYSEDLYFSENMSAPSGVSTTVTGTRVKTVFNATLLYYYDYKMRNFSQAFLKYWGLCGSAEALWNMIPFSFIVDYFIEIGKALHAMEVDSNVRLRDYLYCESLKTTATAGIHLKKGPDYSSIVYCVDGAPSGEGALVTGYEVTRYDRYPTIPNKGIALPRLNNVSDRQLLNMGALLRSFF